MKALTRENQSVIRLGERVYTCVDCGKTMEHHDDCYRHATRDCPALKRRTHES